MKTAATIWQFPILNDFVLSGELICAHYRAMTFEILDCFE